MKRSLKAILLAASVAATTQAVDAQAAQPPAGCTLQPVNGVASWVCPAGTFSTPAPAPTVRVATATPSPSPPPAPAVAGFTASPGIVIPLTAGSSFSIVTAVSIVYGTPQKPSSPQALVADIPVSAPGAASKITAVGIIPGAILGTNMSVDLGPGNRAKMLQALTTLGTSIVSITVKMTTYQYQGGTWSGQSHTLEYHVAGASPRIIIGVAPLPGTQPSLYKVDFDQQ